MYSLVATEERTNHSLDLRTDIVAILLKVLKWCVVHCHQAIAPSQEVSGHHGNSMEWGKVYGSEPFAIQHIVLRDFSDVFKWLEVECC